MSVQCWHSFIWPKETAISQAEISLNMLTTSDLWPPVFLITGAARAGPISIVTHGQENTSAMHVYYPLLPEVHF